MYLTSAQVSEKQVFICKRNWEIEIFRKIIFLSIARDNWTLTTHIFRNIFMFSWFYCSCVYFIFFPHNTTKDLYFFISRFFCCWILINVWSEVYAQKSLFNGFTFTHIIIKLNTLVGSSPSFSDTRIWWSWWWFCCWMKFTKLTQTVNHQAIRWRFSRIESELLDWLTLIFRKSWKAAGEKHLCCTGIFKINFQNQNIQLVLMMILRFPIYTLPHSHQAESLSLIINWYNDRHW